MHTIIVTLLSLVPPILTRDGRQFFHILVNIHRDLGLSQYANQRANKIRPQLDYSIFDAERYFSGVHETRENSNSSKTRTSANNGRLSLSIPRVSSVSDDSYGRNYRGRTTASSEASWNSQIGLLIHPTSLAPTSIRNLPIAGDQTSRKTRASMKWFLRGNKCPCAGKKSVDVEDCNSENEAMKTPPPPPPPRIVQLNRIRCSSGSSSVYTTAQSSPNIKPNLIPDQAIRNFIARPQLNQHNTNPRFSSDQVSVTVKAYADSSGTTSNGFTFPILCNSANSSKRIFNIVQPINIEAPRESLEVFQLQDDGVSAKSRRESYEDEICSDASSDLFEIESFTTTKSTVLRDSLAIAGVKEEENPSIEATECYPPSEVSVDWSVTTAEGFDRSSLARFSGDGEGRRRGNGGGLLTSCRREKAVNVGPNPIKYRQAQRGGM